MTVEAFVALWLGRESNSLLLDAFGIDSLLELFSAGVLLWRLRAEYLYQRNAEAIEAIESRASRLVGYSLYLLAGLVVLSALYRLGFSHSLTNAHESVWGIGIGLVAKIGMPLLAAAKLRVAARLQSRALRADAIEAISCGYLSIVLMIGLAAQRLFGLWWLDSIAALALIPLLLREAREAITGECACHAES
jgi:divalent metal cation (Fe/Co/Zn/Cd) transporter